MDDAPFHYTPRRGVLSPRGGFEEYIRECIHRVENDAQYLHTHDLKSLDQREILQRHYDSHPLRKKYHRQYKRIVSERGLDDPTAIRKLCDSNYFSVERKFSSILPTHYTTSRTPRFTGRPANSVHAMESSLRWDVLQEVSNRTDLCFFDVDFSSCHASIASSLLPENSELSGMLKHEDRFWSSSTEELIGFLSSGLQTELSQPQIKKLLKVSLYSALNGGDISGDTLSTKMACDIKGLKGSDQAILKSNLQLLPRYWSVLGELSSLSSKTALKSAVGSPGSRAYHVFTPVKTKPYYFDKPHLGISRVLQAFEVILLMNLSETVLDLGMHIGCLDHDGLTLCSGNDIEDSNLIDELSSRTANFSHFLLKRNLPLVVKHSVRPEGP